MNTTIVRRCLRPQQRFTNCFSTSSTRQKCTLPIVQIQGGTFYRQYPSSISALNTSTSEAKKARKPSSPPVDADNPPIFPNLTISLSSNTTLRKEYWAVVSLSSLARTTFLQILNNQHISIPPTARSYPFLSGEDIQDPHLRTPDRAVKYVGFDAERGGTGGTSLKGAYISARYESRREETDWTLSDYLHGNTELNPLESSETNIDHELLQDVIQNLKLSDLLTRPVSNLSNGQTRRARIAKSLLSKPELLLLDGPFMGLDPKTVKMLSALLRNLARKNAPRIVLSLRPEEKIPEWISHVVYIDRNMNILGHDRKAELFEEIVQKNDHGDKQRWPEDAAIIRGILNQSSSSPAQTSVEEISRDAFPRLDPPKTTGEPIVEMQGVKVSYGPRDSPTRSTVLGEWQQPDQKTPGLHWSIHRGQRWGIFGPNGSGKTTLLSLITSDHPQAYSLPIKLFGRSRLPNPGEVGISIFELQKRMGHSSPEVHTFFPKHLSLRRVIESAWADAPLAKPKLSHKIDRTVDSVLRWFSSELSPSGDSLLKELKSIYDVEHRPTKNLKVVVAQKLQETDREKVRSSIQRMDGNSDDIDWADTLCFRDLSFSQQRLALFLRAIVAQPDLIILDEAFSGMDANVRNKCLRFLSHGETLHWEDDEKERVPETSVLAKCNAVHFEGLNDNQALIVISHSREDVPGCVRDWICLPEAGEGRPARWGKLEGPLELNPQGWHKIWGTSPEIDDETPEEIPDEWEGYSELLIKS